MSEPLPLHIPAGEGRDISILGLPTTVKIGAADSGGAMFLAEQFVPPGMGVPPHVHAREDEVFFILEGEVEFLVGEQTIRARAGDVLQAPRNVPHGYQGVGDAPAKIWFLVTPGRIEDMFLEMASWPSDAPPDFGKLAELCGSFGIQFV